MGDVWEWSWGVWRWLETETERPGQTLKFQSYTRTNIMSGSNEYIADPLPEIFLRDWYPIASYWAGFIHPTTIDSGISGIIKVPPEVYHIHGALHWLPPYIYIRPGNPCGWRWVSDDHKPCPNGKWYHPGDSYGYGVDVLINSDFFRTSIQNLYWSDVHIWILDCGK